jgi:hypothetical protein
MTRKQLEIIVHDLEERIELLEELLRAVSQHLKADRVHVSEPPPKPPPGNKPGSL